MNVLNYSLMLWVLFSVCVVVLLWVFISISGRVWL